jgi:competence protein ComEA
MSSKTLIKALRQSLCLKKAVSSISLRDFDHMKPSKSMLEETMEMLARYGYRVVYVSHRIIEDYNATYNVMCAGKLITTSAAKELDIPSGEIWISELWRPYGRFIVFHELREIYCRAEGFGRNAAHEKTRRDEASLWKDDLLWQKMNRDIAEMDWKTAERKKKKA